MAPLPLSQRPLWWRVGSFVRFSHTIFALPFALVALFVASDGWPRGNVIFWVMVCMVTARTAAMAFNRLVDWEIDQRNPRTQDRSKLVSRQFAWGLVLVACGGFVAGAWSLNPLCGWLSPLALMLVLGYSFTKRFTAFCHFFLGLALAAAPVGAWAAATGSLESWKPFLLGLAVLTWVAGFDMIYATLDAEFDRREGLLSFPARFGVQRALRMALGCHGLTWVVMGLFVKVADLGWVSIAAWGLVGILLVVEHRWAATGDPVRINQAFFQVNAWVGALWFLGVAFDLIWR